MGSQYSPLIQVDLQALGACVSTKGSNVEITVNPSGDEHHGCPVELMWDGMAKRLALSS
ncbi:hypothetical protein JHK84_034329 [Glycine max]|nr:hypothetical protein JHK84_034329 [Glycine max]